MHYVEEGFDLPEEILSSLIGNRLVIFVGAGVSYKSYNQQKADTYYPLFRGLCEQISSDLAIDLNDEQKGMIENGPLDQLLGIWKDDGRDVQQSASKILRFDEDKKIIKLHKSILNLFPEEIETRIITTNFDNLFNIALKKSDNYTQKNCNIYYAPALPPGRRFSGIAYLHGHISNPKEMILTDKDIGRAYMDEGWALKFSHELFQNFEVLFIGYSLKDPPLRYLSLALEGAIQKENNIKKFRKWALIYKQDEIEKIKKDWIRLGVEPVVYPVKNGSHRVLVNTLIAWGSETQKGFLDKRTTLFQLVKSQPFELPPHQYDLVINYIKTPELLRDMAKYGFNEGWYDILEEKGYLDKLYNSNDFLNEEYYHLALHLINDIIKDPIIWILKLEKYRSSLNPYLFEFFCRKYENDKDLKIEKQTLRQIFELFRPSLNKGFADYYSHSLSRLFKDLFNYDLYDDAVWLLVSILDVDIKIKKSFRYQFGILKVNEADKEPEIESSVSFKGQIDYYLFKKYKDEFFLAAIDKIGYSLLHMLTVKLHHTLIACNRIKPVLYTYIPRPEINKSKEHYSHDVITVFLDSIVELWEELLKVDPTKAEFFVRIWEQIDDSYFKRLTLYAINKLMETGYVQN